MAVYMLKAGDACVVKIGKADSPVKRLAELQSAHWVKLRILRLFVGGLKEEADLQRRFGHLHIRGEWFHFHQDMLGDVGLTETTLDAIEAELRTIWDAVPEGYDRKVWRQCVFFSQREPNGESPFELYARAMGGRHDS